MSLLTVFVIYVLAPLAMGVAVGLVHNWLVARAARRAKAVQMTFIAVAMMLVVIGLTQRQPGFCLAGLLFSLAGLISAL